MKTLIKLRDFTEFPTFSSRKRSESADSLNPYETYGQIDGISIEMMGIPLFSEKVILHEKVGISRKRDFMEKVENP